MTKGCALRQGWERLIRSVEVVRAQGREIPFDHRACGGLETTAGSGDPIENDPVTACGGSMASAMAGA